MHIAFQSQVVLIFIYIHRLISTLSCQRLRFVAVPACLLSDLRLVQCPPELLAVGLGRAMSQLPPQSTERSAPGEGMHSRELVLAAIDR